MPRVHIPVAVLVLLPVAAGIIACRSDTGPTQPAGAAKLAFTVQPSAAASGQMIAPVVRVSVQDASGNTAPQSSTPITLALATSSNGARLSGTLTVSANQGIATFSDLRVDRPGTYTLLASAPGLGAGRSLPFEITLAFTSVSAGDAHTCGITNEGVAYCWGDNTSGQLGIGMATGLSQPTPAPVAGGLVFAAVSAGNRHTCGITTAGAAYCWGYNANGQLGDGTTTDRPSPVAVQGGLTFASISAGFVHSCGLTTTGAAYCWGLNAEGYLGDGTIVSRTIPVTVTGGLTFARLDVGYLHTCGVTVGGAAYCWGDNLGGDLGDGTTANRTRPALVQGGLTFASVSAGYLHTCGMATDGKGYCWGQNDQGALGDGTAVNHATPTPVQNGLAFASLSAGYMYTCGVTTDHAAVCWGRNSSGELGDGTRTSSSFPVFVKMLMPGFLSPTLLSAGGGHACVVTTTYMAYCWGLNREAEIGNGATTDALTPEHVAPPHASLLGGQTSRG